MHSASERSRAPHGRNRPERALRRQSFSFQLSDYAGVIILSTLEVMYETFNLENCRLELYLVMSDEIAIGTLGSVKRFLRV